MSIAQAQAQDAAAVGSEVPATIAGFASLGSCGSHRSSEERDFHRWLNRLHGIQVEPYEVAMKLEAKNSVAKLSHVSSESLMSSMFDYVHPRINHPCNYPVRRPAKRFQSRVYLIIYKKRDILLLGLPHYLEHHLVYLHSSLLI